MHALEVEHLVDVDVEDPGVRVGRAEHRGVQHRRVVLDPDVVDVAALAAQEALVLHALDLLAHQLGGHDAPPVIEEGAPAPVSEPPDSSAARSTALTMFW